MAGSINSLAMMEMMLYGSTGIGGYANCPSLANNYCATSSAYPMVNPQYFNMLKNTAFKGNEQSVQSYNQSIQSASDYINQIKQDTMKQAKIVSDYVSEKNIIEESFTGALSGGLTFAAFENMLTVFHPINSYNAMRKTDKIFQELMTTHPAVADLWKKEPKLMQRAYNQLYTAHRNAESKWFYSKWFQKPISATELTDLQKRMTDALKTGNVDAIRKASEELQAARGMNGRIPQLWDGIRNLFRSDTNKITQKTCQQRIAEKTASGSIGKAITEQKELADIFKSGTSGGISTFLKHGLKEGKSWFLFDLAFSIPKIFTAFKDGGVESGITQTGQSAVKAAGNAVGWVAGKAIGGAIGTKVGAALGTAVCPGLGTAVGAVLGFIGGCVGSWAVGKITNWLIPENKEEASKIEQKKLISSQEGQTQLLQELAIMAQKGEKIPQNVMFAAQQIAENIS